MTEKNWILAWALAAKACLVTEKEVLEEPNKDGKIAAINKLDAGITDIEVTLKTANSVFNAMQLSTEYIQRISGDLEKQKNLLVDVASSDGTCGIKGRESSRHKKDIWNSIPKL